MEENKNQAPLTEEEETERLAEQARIRREKLAKLVAEGIAKYVDAIKLLEAVNSPQARTDGAG